jgi:hypothetical protein
MDFKELCAKARLVRRVTRGNELHQFLFPSPAPSPLVSYAVVLWGSEVWIRREPRGGQLIGFLHGILDLGREFAAQMPEGFADDL